MHVGTSVPSTRQILPPTWPTSDSAGHPIASARNSAIPWAYSQAVVVPTPKSSPHSSKVMFRRNQHRHKRNAPTTSSFGRLPTFGVQSGNASIANSTTRSAARKLKPGRRYTRTCPSCSCVFWQIHTKQEGPFFYADTPTPLKKFPKSFTVAVVRGQRRLPARFATANARHVRSLLVVWTGLVTELCPNDYGCSSPTCCVASVPREFGKPGYHGG